MEWLLQVADEFDDALGVLGHRWLALNGHLEACWLAARHRLRAPPHRDGVPIEA